MGQDRTAEDQNRILREISGHLKRQNHILESLASNMAVLLRGPSPKPSEPEPVVVPPLEDIPVPRVYGWSMAASLQREGGLKMGDIKIEEDDARWIWIGDSWERLEDPSNGV